MFRIFRISLVALLLVGVVGITGCEKAADKAAEEAAEALMKAESGVDVEIDDGGTYVAIEDPDNDTTIAIESESTSLPDSFPSSFPVYEDADITANSTVTMEDSSTFYVSQSTTESFDDVLAWHEKAYEDSDWESITVNTVESEGLSTGIFGMRMGDSQSTTVVAENEDGTVEIQLSIIWVE
jgi:hypothetical protein